MEERKDIDRLFQEKFKDFEKSPGPDMWARIEQELNKDKRKRRLIPIWWRIGGAAALLLLFISVGLNWYDSANDDDTTDPSVVEIENNPIMEEPQVSPRQNSHKPNTNNSSENLAESSEKEGDKTQNNSDDTKETKQTKNYYASANPSMQDGEKTNSTEDTINSSRTIYSLSQLEASSYHSNRIQVYASTKLSEDNTPSMEAYEGESIEAAIAAAEALQEADVASSDQTRWTLAPTVAPVYSTAAGEGSTIHTQFIENSKSSDITMSYGITGSYAISKRLRVRAGVNRVDFTNRTSDVLAFEAVEVATQTQPAVMANISPYEDANVLLMSGASVNRTSAPEAINTMQRGDMTLDYGFIEVPLAVEYRVLDRRFGINLVGGFSTFFLNNNQVSVDFNDRNTVIGEANNINDTSYSANVGLGFDYNISKSLDLMLEPTFKYQINTFSNTFGNVRPYIIGVYTGLSFKF
jgi:hypothetical protein